MICKGLISHYDFEKNTRDHISNRLAKGLKGEIVNISSEHNRNGINFNKLKYLKINNNLLNKNYQIQKSFSVTLIFKLNEFNYNSNNFICKNISVLDLLDY